MIALSWAAVAALVLWAPPNPRVRLRESKTHSRRWWVLILGLAAAPALLMAPAAAIAGTLIIATVTWAVQTGQRRAKQQRMAAVTSSYIGFLLGDVRAGAPVPQALSSAAETLANHSQAPRQLRDAATIAARRACHGAPAANVFLDAKQTCPDLATVGLVLRVAEHHGIPLVELLEQTQTRIDVRLRHRAATTAALQGPQATAVILAVLPAAGLLLGSAMGADPLGFLLSTPLGGMLLVTGVGLTCAGFIWSRQIIQAAAT